MTHYMQRSGRLGCITTSLTLSYRGIIENLKRFSFRVWIQAGPKSIPTVGVHFGVILAGFGWQVDLAVKDGPTYAIVSAGVYTPVASACVGVVL
jgi:hypothetical protein